MGKPVLANGRCDVLRGQAMRSNAGLYYENYAEFVEAVRVLERRGRRRRRARTQRPAFLPAPTTPGRSSSGSTSTCSRGCRASRWPIAPGGRWSRCRAGGAGGSGRWRRRARCSRGLPAGPVRPGAARTARPVEERRPPASPAAAPRPSDHPPATASRARSGSGTNGPNAADATVRSVGGARSRVPHARSRAIARTAAIARVAAPGRAHRPPQAVRRRPRPGRPDVDGCGAAATTAGPKASRGAEPVPPQVHQVLATLGYGDAIGHEVLGIQRVLRAAGLRLGDLRRDRRSRGSST